MRSASHKPRAADATVAIQTNGTLRRTSVLISINGTNAPRLKPNRLSERSPLACSRQVRTPSWK